MKRVFRDLKDESYYNKTNQEGLFLHYKSISNETNLPIIIYNIPSRTGVNIEPQTIKKLSKIQNIVALKDAGGNLNKSIQLLNILPKNFALYSGDDLSTFPLMCMGAKGVISVTANAYPNLVSLMCESILKKDFSNGLRIHKHLYNINTGLFLDINPICVKCYMNLIGRNVGNTRPPLIQVSTKIKKKLERIFIHLGCSGCSIAFGKSAEETRNSETFFYKFRPISFCLKTQQPILVGVQKFGVLKIKNY